uniref:Uncharacterized protein n=1 Tax=Trypanosoma vivax (strain Y486) TaxID=1055687 RepID=G0U293_TRYVY|nr:hypothetical protein TVY486_0902190 [Trypanosoma vivax Y486]
MIIIRVVVVTKGRGGGSAHREAPFINTSIYRTHQVRCYFTLFCFVLFCLWGLTSFHVSSRSVPINHAEHGVVGHPSTHAPRPQSTDSFLPHPFFKKKIIYHLPIKLHLFFRSPRVANTAAVWFLLHSAYFHILNRPQYLNAKRNNFLSPTHLCLFLFVIGFLSSLSQTAGHWSIGAKLVHLFSFHIDSRPWRIPQ